MTFYHTKAFGKQLYRAISSQWKNNEINLVTDSSNWILDWIGHYVSTNIHEQHGVPIRLVSDPVGLRRQIIHFIDRYAYFHRETFRRIHLSNKIFLTWFHGDPTDSDPAIQNLFLCLPEAEKNVEKIVVSCKISEQVLLAQGIPKSKLETIPLGVDLDRFIPSKYFYEKTRATLGIPNDAICVGSFQKDGAGWEDGNQPKLIKGPDIFLQVIEKLSLRYKNLLIILTGPARGYVKQGLDRIGVPYIHHYLTNYHDIVNFYRAVDLYIISSRSEGGPKALLECWATGVPVVSTKVGMPADLVKHEVNGMLADIDDVDGLVNNAVSLIENKALQQQCKCQGLEDVRQYSWSLIANQYYQKLYQPYLE